jgi:hypothetical protein
VNLSARAVLCVAHRLGAPGAFAVAGEVYIPRAVTQQKNVKTNRSHNPAVVALIALAALAVPQSGCADGPGGGGNLRVTKISMVAQPPGNVAAYFSVYTKEGAPVTDLDTPNFKIYENNKLISEKRAKRALLETKPVEAQYMLVLLDVTGPYVDGEDFPDIVTEVGHLVATVEKAGGAVAVGVFDGEDEVVPMLGYGASNEKAAIDSIRKFRPRSRNGNLHGAIMQGLDSLEHQLDTATAPFRFATLVIITDRGDMAKKVPLETVKKRVAESPADVQIVAIGPKTNKLELEPLTRGGLFISPEPKDFTKGLQGVAKKLDDAANARYLFSYCTTKREGNPTLTLVIETTQDRGRLVYKFNAANFRGGCSAKHRPLFEKPVKGKEGKEDEAE